MFDLLAHGAAVCVATREVPTVRILEAVEQKAEPQGTTRIVVVQPRSLARTIRMPGGRFAGGPSVSAARLPLRWWMVRSKAAIAVLPEEERVASRAVTRAGRCPPADHAHRTKRGCSVGVRRRVLDCLWRKGPLISVGYFFTIIRSLSLAMHWSGELIPRFTMLALTQS